MLSKKTSEKLEELLNRLIDEFDSPAHGQADAGRKENIKDIAIAINEISEAYNKVKSIEFLLGNNMLTKDPIGETGALSTTGRRIDYSGN